MHADLEHGPGDLRSRRPPQAGLVLNLPMTRHFRGARHVAILSLSALPLAGCVGPWGGHRATHGPATVVAEAAGAGWTETTWEAATTPKQRKVLERARVQTITGEVVDVSCFLQLGKRGEAHIPCGQRCARNGQPVGLLADDGTLYLLFTEEHHPRRDGQTSLKERFAELMAKRVQVNGPVTTYRGHRALFVRSLPAKP